MIPDSDLSLQPGETTTQFTIRAIRHDAWQEGHKVGRAEQGLDETPNPYRDEAVR